VLDDSFAHSNQDIDISDITQPYNSLMPVSLETQPTPGQEALFKALGLWYVISECYLKLSNHTQQLH
jgi:hypothetical protein